jgi:nucleoside-diphosphate-sugar epimerase
MTLPILVTGGTGTLGRRLVPRLQKAGFDIRVLTRHSRADEDGVRYLTGDLATGEGIEQAVDGVATIVHLAGGNKGDDALTRNLVRSATSAPSWRPSGSSPGPACRGRRYAPPSSTT